jgi:hypothetical protein
MHVPSSSLAQIITQFSKKRGGQAIKALAQFRRETTHPAITTTLQAPYTFAGSSGRLAV